MRTTIEIDTRGFEALVRDLQGSIGKVALMPSTDRVLRSLIVNIIKRCIRWTPMAKVRTIRAKFERKMRRIEGHGNMISIKGDDELRIYYGEEPTLSTTVTDRQRAGLRKWAKQGKNWVNMAAVKNPGRGMMARYLQLERARKEQKTRLKKELAAALGARGLARRAWYNIGEILGLSLGTVVGGSQVNQARPSSGVIYTPGIGRKVQEPAAFYYEIGNQYPFERFGIDGASILSRSVSTEIAAYQQNLRHGVFEDYSAIGRRYPGVTIV